ncbi:unnamed protein product [Effrenium voratum]|nr:unnamed protein product [Effrenium voratum]
MPKEGLVVGAEVFPIENLTVNDGISSKVVVRWGARGEITEILEKGQYLVHFAEVAFGSPKVAVSGEQLTTETPEFRQGQWMQLSREIQFRSKRVMRAGQPGVVRDLREDPLQVLLRLAPVGAVDAGDVCVFPSDLQPMQGLPADFANFCGLLPGGFAPGDAVFSLADIVVQAPEGKSVAVGYGDVGMVFGDPINHESRLKGELLVRFETRQDNGNPVFLSVNPSSLSRTQPMAAGRHVELTKPLRFADGAVESGHIGVVVQTTADGYEGDVIQVHDGSKERSFQPVPGSFALVKEAKLSKQELQARLQELETLAQMNDRAGKTKRNVSMLEQNVWAVCGFGSGLNLSFLTHQSKWPRLGSLSADNKCLTLKPTANEGLDGTLGGESTVRFDHEALIGDETRVAPYAAAIRNAAEGRKVLDIGTGPVCFLARLCLRAGAASADAVESSEASVRRAKQCFEAEVQGQNGASFLPEWAALDVSSLQDGDEICVTAGGSSLRLLRGVSTELQLPGGYTMLVHEILGDMAGNEDAALVVDDIRKRGLLASDCIMVPRSSSTLLAPTGSLERSTLETLIHRLGHNGDATVMPRTRYSARRFPPAALLAEPQAMEVLDFQNGPELFQQRCLEFRTQRDGQLDGVHMHLHVDLDDVNCIDVLDAHSKPDTDSSWNTLYLRLLAEPVELSADSRVLCRCTADLSQRPARYTVALSVGEDGAERELCEPFEWSGG